MGRPLHSTKLRNPENSPERVLVLAMNRAFRRLLLGPHNAALMQNSDFGVLYMELEAQKIQPFPNPEDLMHLHAAILKFSKETGIGILPAELQDFSGCLAVKETEKDEARINKAIQAAADSIILGNITLQNVQTVFLRRVKEAVLDKLGAQTVSEEVLLLNRATDRPRVDWDVRVDKFGQEHRTASGEKIYRQVGREQTFEFLKIPTHEFQDVTCQLDKALAQIIIVTRIEITESSRVEKISNEARRRITSKVLIHPFSQ